MEGKKMIRILDKRVSDKIAAGEVIERPASIVKELMENAVDAGADKIAVEIRKGGKTYIRITDNGCGIPFEETETAFLRHATSKITSEEDLDALDTLGFRGEALASIAAVSRMTMITKTREARTGCRLSLAGGTVSEKKATGCPDGTTMIVHDLFYNTPARAKFLRSDAAETNTITALVRSLAVAYPGIAVRMTSNDKILFATHGRGDQLAALSACFGAKAGSHLLPVEASIPGMKVHGYVSGTGESHASRKEQIFFVNGRVVESRPIERGVAKAYADKLFAGRYPAAYLFLTIDPAAIDVNIHPNKKEIRFDDDKAVTALIRDAVRRALAVKDAVPDLSDVLPDPEKSSRIQDAMQTEASEAASFRFEDPDPGQKQRRRVHETNVFGRAADDERVGSAASEQMALQEAAAALRQAARAEEDNTLEENVGETGSARMPAGTASPAKKVDAPFDFAALTLRGTIFDTYLLAQDQDSFYMIDQHAAHERINYEHIMEGIAQRKGASQIMLAPTLLEAGFADDDWTEPLCAMGYVMDAFGPGTWRVRGIPAFMDETMAREFLTEYIEVAQEGEEMEMRTIIDRAALRACKASVKANDVLHPEEARRLLDDLARCENPFHCPHGRPTFVRMRRRDIEKRFKRV